MVHVVVVGAGVIGLSTALHLLERFPSALHLTVVSERFSPNTTSDKAGALMVPPDEDCLTPSGSAEMSPRDQGWTKATLHRLHSIYRSEENARVQICLQHGYVFLESPQPDPWYKDEVFGFRHVALDSVEAKLIHTPPTCVDVWAMGAYCIAPTPYLCWLMDKIRQRGVRFEQKKISGFEELSSYDIIINCAGLGSRDLLDDKSMYPVRGQLVIAKAPWMKTWLAFSNSKRLGYIIPRAKDVVLGGTGEAHNWNENPDPKTAESILKNCEQHFPSLCGAEVVDGWVGLRPLRDPVRLDSCEGPGGSLLVHCYGHGGEGVILSWGCALDIGHMVQQRLHQMSTAT